MPREISESRGGPWASFTRQEKEEKRREGQGRTKDADSGPELLPQGWASPMTLTRARPHPLPRLLDSSPGHTSATSPWGTSQPGLHPSGRNKCTPSPPPPEVQRRMDQLSHHPTPRQKGRTQHIQLEGESLKCTPSTQKGEGLSLTLEIRKLRPNLKVICRGPPSRDWGYGQGYT